MIRKLLILCILLLPMQASAQFNTNRMLQIGRNALYFDDYVLSIQYFNRVISVKPYLAEPYYYRAMAKFYLDDLNGACKDCDITIDINPFYIDAYHLRGVIKMRLNKSAEALADFKKGLEYEPDNLNLLMNRGLAHILLKEYDQSIEVYDNLLKKDKNNVSAILYRGIAMVETGDTLAALNEFTRATKINTFSADALTYSGILHFQLKDYKAALDDYNRLAKLRPKDATLYINRAITRYNLDDYQGCFDDLDEAIRLDPKKGLAYTNRGMLCAEVGRYEQAAEDFSKSLAIDPSDDITLFNRALIYCQLGKLNNALSDLNIIIAKHPEFGPAYYQRAIVKRQLNDLRGSELDYMTAYTFEQEQIKRGLKAGDNQSELSENEQKDKDKKKGSRSKNDNDIKKYNQMVVVADFGDNDDKLKQNDKETIRGRVQDRDIAIDLEPIFELNFISSDTVLPKVRYYEQCVEDFNSKKLFETPLIVTNREYTLDNSSSLLYLNKINEYTQRIEAEPNNYDLYLIRGTLYNLVMNYNNAINDFNVCLLKNPTDVNALFNRAATRFKMVELIRSMDSDNQGGEISGSTQSVSSTITIIDYDLIIADLRQILEINPDFEFAHYNMSLVQCLKKQHTEALKSLDKAIAINPNFAEAYFNRGIINIFVGKEAEGTSDLSKAGELGIFKAYNVLKRYTGKKDGDE